MYNPRKVWLLYAKILHGIFVSNADRIPTLVQDNLEAVAVELGLNLDPQQKEHLKEIALAFFEQEYLEAYRLAGAGEEPDTDLSALESSTVVEETTGFPVTDLFQRMRRTILDHKNEQEERVAEVLIRDYGAYPAKAVLKMNLRDIDRVENYLPDYCLARAVMTVVDLAFRDRHPVSPTED